MGAEAAAWLRERLAAGPPLLLDGATGTELERRGLRTGLPLWSAHPLLEAPGAVEAVHRAYVGAGAELLTANTFRTQARALAHGGVAHRAAELTGLAVGLARRAARSAPAGARVLVLGSASPLEDCYRPQDVPAGETLAREHAAHAEALREAGADAVLVETMNCVREAACAARAARDVGLPAIVSYVAWEPGRILSGEPLADALAAAASEGALAVGVNCLPPSAVGPCLAPLRACGLPFLVSANLGAPEEERAGPDRESGGPAQRGGAERSPSPARSEDTPPEAFADAASEWLAAGARIVGGCCGTTPAHTRALRARLDAKA